MLFVCYSKCGTCKRAAAWLREHGLSFTERDIKTQNPTVDELRSWLALSGLPMKKFFNTSGNSYKEAGLSKKLPSMNEDEQLELLAADGMLVKRPILITEQLALVGFNEKTWGEALLNGAAAEDNR